MTLRIVAGDRSRPEILRQRTRTDRLAVGDIAFDQGFQQGLGAGIELHDSILASGKFRCQRDAAR